MFSDSMSVDCDVKDTDPASCGFDVMQLQITYNTTLLVTNSLGQESETYIFNITDRGEYESFYLKDQIVEVNTKLKPRINYHHCTLDRDVLLRGNAPYNKCTGSCFK